MGGTSATLLFKFSDVARLLCLDSSQDLVAHVVQDLVDQQMRALGAPPAMQTVMGGKFAQQIICRTVNFRSEKEEDFYQVAPTCTTVPKKRCIRNSTGCFVEEGFLGQKLGVLEMCIGPNSGDCHAAEPGSQG